MAESPDTGEEQEKEAAAAVERVVIFVLEGCQYGAMVWERCTYGKALVSVARPRTAREAYMLENMITGKGALKE